MRKISLPLKRVFFKLVIESVIFFSLDMVCMCVCLFVYIQHGKQVNFRVHITRLAYFLPLNIHNTKI